MKPSLILTLACAAALGISTAGFAADPPGRADAKPDTKPADAKAETKTQLAPAEIKGEVLKVDGDTFVVNDERSKKEVKFTIEKDVKATLDRPLKQGDRIEAYLTPEGLAKKVRFEGAKDSEMMNQTSRDPGSVQTPGGLSREMPPGGQGGQPDQGMKAPDPGGMKSPEGSNPTLSPGGKGSASGG